MRIKLYPPLYIHEIGKRPNQEDSLYPIDASSDSHLFVLCDGMGGHENGEVASQTICRSLGKWFSLYANPDETLTDDQLRTALEFAYTQLDGYFRDGQKQMGTTLTLLYIHPKGVIAAHIGDSRIYHIRPQKGILYQSRDHSLVFDLLQAGEITYEEIATYPQKNVITRAMTPGKENRMRPDIIHVTDIKKDDWFYMCSDGMLEQMTNEELVLLLSSDASDGKKREELINATAHNQDNHTAWLIHIEDVMKEKGDEALINEELTARCNVMNIVSSPIHDMEEDVEGDDDVVVISVPSNKKMWQKKKNKVHAKSTKKSSLLTRVLKCMVFVIFFLCLLMAAWTLYQSVMAKPEPQPSKVKVIRKVKSGKSKKTKINSNNKALTNQSSKEDEGDKSSNASDLGNIIKDKRDKSNSHGTYE